MMLVVTAVTLTGILSCKPSEKNYRKAYEATINGRDTTAREFDETIYGRYRRQMRRTQLVVSGDTLDVRSQRVSLTKSGGGKTGSIKAYMVVIGGFKQLFNAQSMRERLVGMGWPETFVVQTAEPYYFVVVSSYNDVTKARADIEKITENPPFRLGEDYPFVLNPPRTR